MYKIKSKLELCHLGEPLILVSDCIVVSQVLLAPVLGNGGPHLHILGHVVVKVVAVLRDNDSDETLLLLNVITHGFEEWSSPPHDEDLTRGLLFQEPPQHQGRCSEKSHHLAQFDLHLQIHPQLYQVLQLVSHKL